MFALLAIGLWPWIAIILLFIIVISALELESDAGAFWGLVLGMTILYFATNGFSIPSFSGMLTWIDRHIIDMVLFVVGYAAAGVTWGTIKYKFWTHNLADEWAARDRYMRDDYETYKRRQPAGMVSNTYKQWLEEKWTTETAITNNKVRITRWMAYWWASFVWTMARDPMKHFWRWAIQRLGTTYARMSAATFASRFSEIKD